MNGDGHWTITSYPEQILTVELTKASVFLYDVMFRFNKSFCLYFIKITELFSLRKNSLQIHVI